jgi:hypothetical protein
MIFCGIDVSYKNHTNIEIGYGIFKELVGLAYGSV